MTVEGLTTFLGWCTVLNFGLLTFSTVMIVTFRRRLAAFHQRLFPMEEEQLSTLYFSYLARYKVLVIVLNVVPYLSLKLMQQPG